MTEETLAGSGAAEASLSPVAEVTEELTQFVHQVKGPISLLNRQHHIGWVLQVSLRGAATFIAVCLWYRRLRHFVGIVFFHRVVHTAFMRSDAKGYNVLSLPVLQLLLPKASAVL